MTDNDMMIKVFISQPMRGKTYEQVMKERLELVELFESSKEQPVMVIDSVFRDFEPDTPPLVYIAESIRLLSDADILVMMPGWEKANGCVIERECALRYGIPIVYHTKPTCEGEE